MATVFITPPQQNQSSSMAVNLFPDTPRISFSYNLDHLPSPDHNLVARSDQNLSSDDPDFDFDFRLPDCRSGQEASPADELFLNGVLLPAHIKPTTPILPTPTPTTPSISKKHDLAEEEQGGVIVTSTKASLIREEKGQPKSFWRFMRSTSLNYDSSHSKKGSIWSSLPLLARSNSTGHGKLHSSSSSSNHRQPSKLPSSGSVSSSSTRVHHNKPPLRKAQFSGSGNSSPVLNVPSPYITKGTSDLLGLGSFFRGGNAKKGKKP